MIDQNDPRLTGYVLGELSSAESAEIETAIENSPELEAAVEEIRGMVGMLGDAYASEEKLSLSDEQKVTLSTRPKAAKSDEARRWIAVAVAASLAAIVFGGWTISQDYFKSGSRRRNVVARNGIEELAPSYPEVVYQMETKTRTVPVQKTRIETRTRSVPATKMRTETREVALDDGTTETKKVQVPYTENVVQNYTVEVPYTENIAQSYQEAVPYTADGERIDVADYGKYGISRGPAELPAKFPSGGEAPMVVPPTDVAMGGGLGGAIVGGGIAEKDFEKLTELIEETVDSDEWSNTGSGDGEIKPFAANLSLLVENSQSMRGEGTFSVQGHAVDPAEHSAFGNEPSDGGATSQLADLRDSVDAREGQSPLRGHSILDDSFSSNDKIQRMLKSDLGADKIEILESESLASHDRRLADRMSSALRSANENAFDKSKEAIRIRSEADEQIADITGKFEERSKALAQADRSLAGEKQRATGKERDLAELESELAREVDTYTFGQAKTTDKSTNELLDELLEEAGVADSQRAILSEENRELVIGAREFVKRHSRAPTQEELAEMKRSLAENGELRRDSSPSQMSELKMKLLEAKAAAELARAKIGTGHPDYEAAAAQIKILEQQLAAEEELQKSDLAVAVDQTKRQIGRVRSSLQQVLVSFKQVDELKKAGSIDDRKATMAAVKNILAKMQAEVAEIEQRVGNGHAEFKSVNQQIEALKAIYAKEKELLDKAIAAQPKSWKRVKAIPNTTRLMVGDKEELSLNGMQVNAQVDGFRARVLVDYFYYNDRERQLEGNFKLRLPDDASLYYFAFGESVYKYSPEGKLAGEEFLSDGTQFVSLGAQDVKRARKGQWDNVKESRMVPKEKAAHAFRETVRRRVDPALVEWSGAGVFNAKVFPLAPKKLHRIVVGYDVNLKRSKDGLKFELSLPEQTGECRVELNVQEIEGISYTATPAVDPVPTELDGKLQKRFVFDNDDGPLAKIELSVNGANESVLRSSDEQGEFWTLQSTPELPVEDGSASSRAIFMVDTSLSTSPDKFNVWLKMLESTLNNNRDSLKEFDVLFFNVDSHFWKNKYVANTAENVAELKTTLENLALEGATDLYGAIQSVAGAGWTGDENNRPDLFLLSDGAATWGETDLRLINQMLQQPKLGSLFAYQTGLNGTAISGLRFLAGQSGGAVFSVATEDEIKTASTAHRKRPWQLKSIAAAGASDILTAGRVQWVYPGQTITVVGRGNVEESIELQFQQGNETKTVALTPKMIQSELASRMYGHVAVGQLESLGSQVVDVSAAYARHFRITGQTCSLLMLESEEDYKRFDIKPQEDLFVVKAKATSKLVAETLEKFSQQLIDPKAKLQAWLTRLESMPGMKFKMPTALRLAMDDIKVEAISEPMDCSLTLKDSLSEAYLSDIKLEQLNYGRISFEARRRATSSVDDAIKVYSSLVERSPGDIVVARDVAFTAMRMERPAQAFHLLRRVARARPFQGNIYPAIGQCLAQLGKADMAIVYYEIAMNGTFQRQGGEFKQIVAAEYIHLLRQITSGKLESSVKDFAAARLETLGKHLPFGTADVVVTMMWNQDQTDVDMHVIEPNGEECSYQNKNTNSGGQITSDIRTGFGPEMYFNANAPRGKYELKAKFFGSGQNRTSTRNKVYMTIIRGFGTDEESMTRRTIELDKIGEKVPVMTFGIEP